MKVQDIHEELDPLLRDRFENKTLSKLARSAHKQARKLHARALRRAFRRSPQ